MKRGRLLPDAESVLESGLLVMALGCLGGFTVLLFGRASGRRSRAQQLWGATGRGVPAERHHHVGLVSAR